jgi:chromate transporter
LIVLSVISFFYVAFQTNPIILAMLRGMRGAVTAVLFVSSYSMLKSVLKADVPFALTMMISAFLIGWLTDLSVAYLMLGAGTMGYLYYTHLRKGVNA